MRASSDGARRQPPLKVTTPVRVVEVVTGGLLVTYVASTWLRHGYSPVFDSWVGNLAYGGAAVLCAWRAAARRTHRLGWAVIALALGVFTLGSVLWTTTIQFIDPVPYPSAADACFLVFYPIGYVGIGLLIRGSLAGRRDGVWFDGLIAMSGIAAFGASVVIGPISHHMSGRLIEVLTNLAYPVGDLVLVMLVVGFFAVRGWRPGGMWWALGFGLLVFAVADSFYVWRVAMGSYQTGTPLDAMWAIAAFIIAMAAWHGKEAPASADVPAQPAVVPVLFILASLAIVVYATWHPVVPMGVVLASCTLLLAIGRMGYSYRQLRGLAQSRREARTDELTGLGNRRMFYAALERALATPSTSGLAVLMIDLDRFKEINDSLGHRVGDDVLRQLGPRLASILRPQDTLARLGGDEFGVILHGASIDSAAMEVADRIRATLERPFSLDGVTLRVDASIGIALSPRHGRDADVLLQKADVAMYEAKTRRQSCAVYVPEHHLHSRDRLQLVEELRDALAGHYLEAHYQPKLDIDSGRISGVEALVRWPHPTRGLLPPGLFVPLAEQTGLMSVLSRMMIERAVAQLAAWSRDGLDLTVSVNLSVSDLVDEQLPVTVARILAGHRVAPRSLVLEITEDGFMSDPNRVRTVLEGLRAVGCELAIDDYGTGFSSLGYLRDLPVSELKLDRTFVVDATTDHRARAIVRSTIELAHSLGLRIVAEGVEDRATLLLLDALGCDAVQGYYIGRPAPAGELTRVLLDSVEERAG